MRRALSGMVFLFQAEDGIRDYRVTGVQTCALPILQFPRVRTSIPWRTVMKQTFGMFFAMCALAAMPALAQTKPASSKTPSSKPAAAQHADQGKGAGPDAAFAKEAAVGGMAEVELGNLAKEKASNNDVKQFGDRMVTDHSK